MQRRTLLTATGAMFLPWLSPAARAHHGWSGFDQNRPLYLEGDAATVRWRNPHVEIDLELRPGLALPPDLAQRQVPAQTSPVDAPALLRSTRLPDRKDRRWTVELAPLARMQAWQVAEIKPGTTIAVVGFTTAGEQGPPVLRAEYLFVAGKAYALRSSPV
ncbi:DUF6152 family protein [Caldimonas brevitalea]|uniref:Uncharacterized protein n=1 Tax=Caldimonas brevitalea TaxID=413882 RepID=A0A0G3BS61_9BURK|nr:DUF6152 family protein [Caldimonas brevitalea]AKJ29355.1 hypothetical protein AAW51_2664 [Caldimonas brevitalea]